MTDYKLLSVKEVANFTGLSVPSVWRLCAKGTFPKPIKLAEKTTRWRSDVLKAWVESHA